MKINLIIGDNLWILVNERIKLLIKVGDKFQTYSLPLSLFGSGLGKLNCI